MNGSLILLILAVVPMLCAPLAWALGLLGAVLIGIPLIALLAGLTIGLAAGGFVCVAMGVFVLFSGFSALFTGGLATTM